MQAGLASKEMTMADRKRTLHIPAMKPLPWEPLPLPPGTLDSTLVCDGEEILVLSYPVPRWCSASVLTEAEQAVAEAVLRGESRSAVAKARKSSPRTVANLLAQAFRKLGVNSRVELAAALAARQRATTAELGAPPIDGE